MYATAHIRHKAVDGRVVILDLRAADYLILNRAASAMWKALLATADVGERLARLQREFAAPADRLAADLDAFARDCETRGLLQRRPLPAPRRAVATGRRDGMLALRAWWVLCATLWDLRRHGLDAVYSRHAALPLRPAAEPADPERLARAVRAFLRAENLFLLRRAPNDCLPRSLALHRFLSAVGLPARHYIGVQRLPFRAHAWVESGGRVLLDDPEQVRSYAILGRI